MAAHTSSFGFAWEYRRAARRLAELVRHQLLRGIEREPTVVVHAYGESRPATSNLTWPGRERNRRVVVAIDRQPVVSYRLRAS